ncbi:heavy-metal-associated domain-containing protein [Flavobacterium sp. JP2137]|uniref:heavy-metal-associated domain-containing protein n=1 Tax=Flavobacterium sp. JP2137 TaxID=3414510 RepID=UPI003D2FA509
MKNISIQFLALTLLVLLTGFQSQAQISKVDIIATGLTCSMCSNAINKQLQSLAEVERIGTDLNTNTFTVFFKDGQAVEPKVLKNAVEKAGFFVGSMVLTADFKEAKIEDNAQVLLNGATYVFIDTKSKSADAANQFRVLDKGFVTQKEYKKLIKSYSKYPTYAAEKEEDYHLKAI